MYWDPPMQQRTRATLTWPNAVHHRNEGCAIPPAWTKVPHLFWSLINNVCPKNIFKLKKYFVIIFPPLLTSTPSWRETWAWTHCSSAFLAPSFHFSCALRTLPSRTEQYRFNIANIFRKSRYFLTWAGVCVSVLAAGVSAALDAGAGEPLAKLLQDSGVLLNLDKRGVLVKTRLYLV